MLAIVAPNDFSAPITRTRDAPHDDLPDHYRAVIILHNIEGLSMAEVGDVS
jgi:hypothetical protein